MSRESSMLKVPFMLLEIYVRISAKHVRKYLTERPKAYIESLDGITISSTTSCSIFCNY